MSAACLLLALWASACGKPAPLEPDAAADAGALPAVRAEWARAIPTDRDECLSAAAFADNRYLLIGGSFAGTTDFGNGPVTSGGPGDLFVLALDIHGGTPVTRTYASTGGACGGFTIDGDGLVTLVGGLAGDLSFEAKRLSATGRRDPYLASISLDTPGVRFARGLGTFSATGGGALRRAASGRDASTTAVGWVAGEATLEGAARSFGAGRKPLVVRIDTGGATAFATAFDGAPDADAEARDVSVDSSGNAVVVGSMRGRLTLMASHTTEASAAFVVQLAPDGTTRWDRLLGGAAGSVAAAEAVTGDLAGTSVVVGNVESGTDPPVGGLIWKLDAFGATSFRRTVAGVRMLAAASDVGGQIYVGGQAASEVNLDGLRLPIAGAAGVLLALDTSGRARWLAMVGGPGESSITHLTVSRAHALYVTGWFRGRVEVFGVPLESATRAGFVAKIVP